MRAVGGLIGLILAGAIGLMVYKFYFTQGGTSGALANPIQTIDAVGVRNDLIGIAQAERQYQAENSSYASFDQLGSSGTLRMMKAGRGGYTYEVETSSDGFRVLARCPAATAPGCTNYSVDQSMEVTTAP
jgi:hypothetical protein